MKYAIFVIIAILSVLIVACAPDQTNDKKSSLTENIANTATDIVNTEMSDAKGETVDGIPVDEYDHYTLDELASHNNRDDCWVALEGKIYDVTAYIGAHPGGEEAITEWCGTTQFEDAFRTQHGTYKDQALEKETTMIGLLDE